MVEVRQAEAGDIGAICSLDAVAQRDKRRVDFIRNAVDAGSAWVATVGSEVVGYVVFEYTFYRHGFVSMLYVRSDYRRKGVGTELIRWVEGMCRTEALFTSTNESNLAMQKLLTKIGFTPSGVINNINPGEPEIVYFKALCNE